MVNPKKPSMYSIRKATLNDLPVLLKFEQGLIAAERPMDPTIKDGLITYYSISDLINNKESDVFVAVFENQIIGSGYAKIKSDRHYLKHKNQGYLGFMFVVEPHRGNGVNKLILNSLLQWCKQRKILEIRLDVYDTNYPAIKAYEKLGFKKHMINMRLDITDIDL